MQRTELRAEDPEAARPPSRVRKIWCWIRRHPLRALGCALLFGFVGVNFLAFRHAGAMTTFVADQPSTQAPEALSFGQKASAVLLGVSVRRPVNSQTPAAHEMPFTTHTLRAGEARLETWLIPASPSKGVVVLCHGYAASKSSLLPVAAELRALGYTCLLLDFRGSGGSSGDQTSLGYHEAEDVAAAVAFAKERAPAQPLILFGTSMGAAAVLRAIHTQGVLPDALILEAPFNRLVDTVGHRFELMGAPRSPGAELLVFWGSVRGGIDGFSHNPADYAKSVECPTLVLHGDQDARVSVAEVREVFGALPEGSRALTIFEGVGHERYVDVRPLEWRAAVTNFLSTLEG
ncbi:MAG: alpha/beta fold hydrolase [Planctomycetes bacterium]|nr:alpha/beta fold hydrolase [Planctomycetota bacterium]